MQIIVINNLVAMVNFFHIIYNALFVSLLAIDNMKTRFLGKYLIFLQ